MEQEAPAASRLFQIPPCVLCIKCGSLLPLEDSATGRYFQGVTEQCSACGAPLDWWEAILNAIKGNFSFGFSLTPVGAYWTIIPIVLHPGGFHDLRMADYGVPEDAKVLQLVYTPQGGNLFPVEFHGNMPPRHLIPHTLHLYPVPLAGETPQETTVSVFVVWVPHSADDYAWQSLVDAFEAYSARRYPAMVIPANVAVESVLGSLMADFFFQHASKEKVKPFLRDATYGHQLNVILPALLRSSTAPPLPTAIRGLLNRLRDLRHQMAHEGRLEEDLHRNEAAELLCAALFGFRYVSLVRPILLPGAESV